VFHWPVHAPQFGAVEQDPLAAYRAAQEARRAALSMPAPSQPGGLPPPPAPLPPVQVLAPPTPVPTWAIYGGIALGVGVLFMAGYALWRRS